MAPVGHTWIIAHVRVQDVCLSCKIFSVLNTSGMTTHTVTTGIVTKCIPEMFRGLSWTMRPVFWKAVCLGHTQVLPVLYACACLPLKMWRILGIALFGSEV